MKNQDLGGDFPKKMGRGLWQFAYLRGKFAKKKGWSIWGDWGDFLMTPWLIGIKYLKQITLCCTNTVILLISSGITNAKKFQLADR